MNEWRIMKSIFMDGQYVFVEDGHWYIVRYNFEEKVFELYKTNPAFNQQVKIYKHKGTRLIASQMYEGMRVFNRADVDAVEKLSELPDDIHFLPTVERSNPNA